MKSSTARIPVKLHKNVTLVRTTDPVLAEELLARKTLARWVVGRFSDTVLLVQPDESELVIEELRRMGHTPRIVRARGTVRDVCRVAVAAEPEPGRRSNRPPTCSRRPDKRGPTVGIQDGIEPLQGGSSGGDTAAQGTLRDAARIRPIGNADEITEHLDQPSAVEQLIARVAIGSRLALSLFALTETTSMSLAGVAHTLGILGRTDRVDRQTTRAGFVGDRAQCRARSVRGFPGGPRAGNPARLRLRAHPAVTNGVRTARPEVAPPGSQARSGRSASPMGWSQSFAWRALWQRVGAEPLRQTHQGTLYKRDRDRLTEDPVLACSIADALRPLARLPELWLELACHVGLIERDPAGDRLLAASSEFWTDNAVHLPQMIATGWIGLRSWQELQAKSGDANAGESALPFLRLAVLLLLSALGESEWAPLDELAAQLSRALAGVGQVVARGTSRGLL